MTNTLTLCGLDEAGRGALAGPLVAAAVVLNGQQRKILNFKKVPLKDGKLLSSKQRNIWYRFLVKNQIAITTEVISTRQINNHGIGWANKEIFRRLIKKVEAASYIVDGNLKLGRINGKRDKIKSIVDADAKITEVILAGIVAKAQRDKIMKKLHFLHASYGWGRNAGYATKKHLVVIKKRGVTNLHRLVFVTTALRNFV